MALKNIEDIFLYLSTKPEDHLLSVELISWFDHADIEYVPLEYNHKGTIPAVNSWFQPDPYTGEIQEPLTTFPFVIYTEIHEDPTIADRRKYLFGKEEITTKLPGLYSLGR